MASTVEAPPFGELPEGFRLGPYTLMHKLGSGGMADVYFAMHDTLHRPAAIKVLRPSLAADESNLQRFMQEARAAASLVHPNIVQVYDVGQQDSSTSADSGGSESTGVQTSSGSGIPVRYIAQEYVAGTNLRQYLDQHGTLSIREALSILLQTLAALKKSSSVGIVHRDIKPENILLTADGDVKVTDFGLARLLHDDPQLTRAGTTLGTPMYMSPEQLQDGEVDVRSDLYSLGVTLFHMLAGKPPFSGETPLALAMQHVQAQPPKLIDLRSDVPKPLSKLVDRLLAKQPQDRFGNPDEVVDYLRAERKNGLAESWPEQTIPLPGAQRPTGSAAPSAAAIKLQAQLNRLRNPGGRLAMRLATAIAVCLLMFGVGVVIARTREHSTLFGNSQNMHNGVPKQPTVEQQYLHALFSQSPKNRSLWEAITYFYPPEENLTNLVYSGKARLQLARQLRQSSEDKDRVEAEKLLRQIVDTPEMEEPIKSLAWLEIYLLAEDRGDDKSIEEAVTQISTRIQGERMSEDDYRIFISNLPERLRNQFQRNTT